MAYETAIAWTETTWNPVSGCTKISAGCDRCYAHVFAERWRGVPGHAYEQGFDLKLWPERLALPSKWRKPRRVFVNSMSDLFHKDIPDDFRHRIFDVMEQTPRHTYQVLTKRSSLMRRWLQRRYEDHQPPGHIWTGVTVENRAALARVAHLRDSPAAIRWLSIEPLIEDLGPMDLTGIDWIVVGGESGPGARPMDAVWARNIRDQCAPAGVAFFFKQWSGTRPKKLGNLLDGRAWEQYPEQRQQSLTL